MLAALAALAVATEAELQSTVKLLNNLSSELDVLRPNMLYTALEVIHFNHNRKAANLKFFEWGKTYSTTTALQYNEQAHFCIYLTGETTPNSWKGKGAAADLYYLKGVVESVLKLAGVRNIAFEEGGSNNQFQSVLQVTINGQKAVELGQVTPKVASAFDIKLPVFVADFAWEVILKSVAAEKITYKPLPKYPSVERDLAIVVPKGMPFAQINNLVKGLRLEKLQEVKLFDVFESEKLGVDKKSLAINFTFLDEEKTLTDKEIDGWMQKIMSSIEKETGAEIRK